MHKFILKLFELFKETLHFIRIVCVFLTMMIVLYWIQNLINANWSWMNFIKGTLDSILAFSDTIYPAEWQVAKVNIQLKYPIAIALLLLISIILSKLSHWTDDLKRTYKNVRIDYKKMNEKIVNHSLQKAQQKEETKITNYCVFIQTRINKKYASFTDNNIDEQNKQMLDFIYSKINVQYMNFKNGFLFYFDDFSNIDNILDVMFKVLNGKSRLDYLICVQVNYDLKQTTKLADLKHYGKIIMAADTAYRYKFNKNQRYNTEMMGTYQNGDNTIEIHEFKVKETI